MTDYKVSISNKRKN